QGGGMEVGRERGGKARMHGLRSREGSSTLCAGGRGRPSHLRWYRDGWRSLRFYLLMSPQWFFGIPGLTLLVCGVLVSIVLLPGPVSVMSITFDYHTLMYSTSAVILGYQSILLFIFAELMAL